MTQKLMIVDGNSIMNRAFYGLKGVQLLATSDGLYTNAIYGFLNILFRYKEEEKPDYICIAFDLKAPTFRHLEFDGYKAHRKGMPDELRVQVPVLKEVIDALNIKRLEIEGYEADDILGTIAKMCENNNIETCIVTGDRDSFQLISDKVKVKIPTTRAGKHQTDEFTLDKFTEEYGIKPAEFVDVKALMGDASDNIPGVPGIGEKTALDLIQKFKSIENIIENIETLDIKTGVKQKIKDNIELALLSKRLAKIHCEVPLNIELSEIKVIDVDNDKLYKLFKRLEFNTLIEKFKLKGEQVKSEVAIKIAKKDDIEDIIKKIVNSSKFMYSIQYDISDKTRMIGIGINVEDEIYYIPVAIFNDEKDMVNNFKDIFENSNIGKSGNALKHDIVALSKYNISFNNIVFDASIAAYLLNPSRDSYTLSNMAQEYLGISFQTDIEFFGKGNDMKSLDTSIVAEFVGNNVDCINKLEKVLKEKIVENEQQELFYDIELPLVEVLADMEIQGFKVDKEQLQDLSYKLLEKIIILEQEIYSMAGEEFNINSPKQMGVILFDKLKLPVIKKTKTGYSTDAEVLEILQSQHEVVAKILEYRTLTKLKSTYAEGLINVINPETGKIHSSFNQTIAQTGRISSTEPNLQNIPVRLEIGREFRKVFIASNDDFILVDADYSQIELRILAHIADDEHMQEAFRNNQDIHRKTASEVFNVPFDEVTSEMRSNAKAVNFGIVYGIGEFSLGKDLGISRKEAKNYIDSYLDNFTGVKTYMHETIEYGKIKGYVTTLLNRRRYLPELKSSNFNMRSFGERVAMNMPIQGTAADIIKIAMVNVYKELKNRKLKSKLILQVHDELIIETYKDELILVKEILRDKMTNALKLKVPLEIDMNVGRRWYDAK